MTDEHPEGWWQASDGNWYPPKLPPPPGQRRITAFLFATFAVWISTFIAFAVEHNAQAAARGDCALYDMSHGTHTYDVCPTPALSVTYLLAFVAVLVTVTTIANVRQARKL